MATLEKLTFESRIANVASTGAALLVDSQNGDKFLKRRFGGSNLAVTEQAGPVVFGVTIEEISPGVGNHHVVNGTRRTPLKSYPLVAGANIEISTRVEAEGNRQDLLTSAPHVTTLQSRVTTLEATNQVVRITNPYLGEPMHFVLVGSNIIPLVAGPGVQLETVR